MATPRVVPTRAPRSHSIPPRQSTPHVRAPMRWAPADHLEEGPSPSPVASAGVHPRFQLRDLQPTHAAPHLRVPFAMNLMAPLIVGDPHQIDSPESKQAWAAFEKDLTLAKRAGATAISTDVWWGLIEPKDAHKPGDFDFRYFDRVVKSIRKAGLKWAPILSFHACGGNVGDTVNIPIPTDWLGPKYRGLLPAAGDDAAFTKSEQGNINRETLSVWATPAALPDYREVMEAFQAHFAKDADVISEINLSMGPAGELRYPSYNSHDKNAGYPTRGALQFYSPLAIESFRDYVLQKYGSIENVGKAWGKSIRSREDILPPPNAASFLAQQGQFSAYGKDLFDWNGESLTTHLKALLDLGITVFDAEGAAFKDKPLAFKIAGIHWRAALDRLPELSAGFIRSSEVADWKSDAAGHGYRKIVDAAAEAGARPNAPPLIVYETAAEMPDGGGGPAVGSLAKSLVFWFAYLARGKVTVKVENALPIADQAGWDNLGEVLQSAGGGTLRGATLLRMSDVVDNPKAFENFARLTRMGRLEQPRVKSAHEGQ